MVLMRVQYGRECFCGNAAPSSAKKVAAAQCSMACSGDGAQKCGAGDRIQVYQRAPAKRAQHRRRRLASSTH